MKAALIIKALQGALAALAVAFSLFAQARAEEPAISRAEALALADEAIEELNQENDLFAACGPLGFTAVVRSRTETPKVEEEFVRTAVRSRIRSARLYAESFDSASGILRVSVWVGGENNPAFTNLVWFEKRQSDEFSNSLYWSLSGWFDWRFGLHGNDPARILSVLAISLDRFIDDYLRVKIVSRRVV